MKNYIKLKLPENPLKEDVSVLQNIKIEGGYNLVPAAQLLSDEMQEIFSGMGLRPKFISLFGRNDSDGKTETRMIHSDVGQVNGAWKKLLFGINWEITGHKNLFSWWNMDAVTAHWPGSEYYPPKYQYLNGVHFGERFKLGIPDGAVKLDEVLLDKPTLVRTDIPHMTHYKGDGLGNRVGISVRFFEDDFKSWEEVYNFFSRYSIDE
jgi:hypothetical protein